MNSLKFQDRLLGLQDNLLNFAYMLTANREEAKDLLQDTTLKALDNEDKYIDNYRAQNEMYMSGDRKKREKICRSKGCACQRH